MSDFLLEMSKNPTARRLIKSLGLPLPLPSPLRRTAASMEERPLADRTVVFGSASAGEVAAVCARTLTRAGASPVLVGGDALVEQFREFGEAYARPARRLDLAGAEASDIAGLEADAIIMDATEIDGPRQLRRLFEFFSPLVRSLGRSGRLVVIGRPADEAAHAAGAAARAALSGFVRSAAKEIGKRGSTAQLFVVESGAERHLEGTLRYFLSDRSAFITGQVLRLKNQLTAERELRLVRPLEGRVALVTGAARGIGAATAAQLSCEGARVICLDRPDDDEPLSRVAREVGGEALLVDVASPTAASEISAFARARGGLSVVVHNAGVTRDKTLAKMSAQVWDQAIDINLTAVAQITEALAHDGAIRDGARIICLSSVAGIAGNMGQTNYAASKAGIIGLVRRLAGDLAGREVGVFAVAPGFIETRLTQAIPVVIREVARRLSALGQGGVPEDVAALITFLSTPASAGLTGETIRVCGGSFVGA